MADCVPLVDENRRLVREGLRALASTRKPGLQALMRVARVDPSGVDAGAIGFRLAPRINAAGRLHRADAGLELLLTADVERARAIAEELDRVNVERRDVETRILFEAEAQVAQARADGAEPAAYVLAGDGWHPGVIGIVASRIAERHHRPAVLIALDGDGGTGSGRSIPAFDLLGGLDACAADLLRHGGHRAAAGLTIARERVDAFRAAFAAHAAATLTADDLVPRRRVDAVVPGDVLQLGLAEELQRLAPFGMANPEPALLVPSALLADPRPMGEGRHVSFTLAAGGARSRCVSFGRGSALPADPGTPVDAAVGLEVNRYNGAVEPRLVLRHAQPARPAPIERVGELPLAEAIRLELMCDPDAWADGPATSAARADTPTGWGATPPAGAAPRERTRQRRGAPPRRPAPPPDSRPARAGCSSTPATAASPGCSATSSRPARPCSPSPPIRASARPRSAAASAASRSRAGARSRRIRRSRRRSRTSWPSTRRPTPTSARSPRSCPATAGPTSRGAPRSASSRASCSPGSWTCARSSPTSTARSAPPRGTPGTRSSPPSAAPRRSRARAR